MEQISNQDFILALFQSIGQLKGATTLTLVIIITQLLMQFLKTPLANFASKYKLLLVTFFSLVLGIAGLMKEGLSFGAAIIHSSTIAAIQVFIHQIYKQFIEKK
jgi:hypothetical protein